jgi:hypothetical protein
LEKYIERLKNSYRYTPQTLKYLQLRHGVRYQIKLVFDFHRIRSMEFYIGTGNEGKAEFQNTQALCRDKTASNFPKLSGPMAALV